PESAIPTRLGRPYMRGNVLCQRNVSSRAVVRLKSIRPIWGRIWHATTTGRQNRLTWCIHWGRLPDRSRPGPARTVDGAADHELSQPTRALTPRAHSPYVATTSLSLHTMRHDNLAVRCAPRLVRCDRAAGCLYARAPARFRRHTRARQ